ncbi:hypothetical protein [Marmoricola sp. RAF53]|uniref:hypothetical protein n=1 Tax=Marmoricola sp. RAF53 TaxID=3233059 RepID=UPI003F94A792
MSTLLPEYMSREHVDAMNELLLDDAAVRAACAQLDRPRAMTFHVLDGPGGEDIFWTMLFDTTLQFLLHEQPEADILVTVSWDDMLDATRAARAGAPGAPRLDVRGSAALFTQLLAIMEVGRAVATLDIRLPGDPA